MGLFSKKDKAQKEDNDAAARNALFGNRAPASQQNPYAAASTPPPPPYQQQPPQQQQQQGYGGYGQPPAATSAGGYGGYGRANSTDTLDRNKNELFAGRQSAGGGGYGQPPPNGSGGGYGQSGGYSRPDGYAPGGSGGYGSNNYGESRELTAEEEEDEDVEAVKQQIRFTKQESVSSTRNALRIAAQAEETGRNTLARLGEQGERLYNTEKNLDMAAAHNRVADEKARELKTLNRSMFAVHVANPLKSKSRAEAEERKILERHESERDERERVRQHGYAAKSNVEKALNKSARPAYGAGRGGKVSLADRSRYQFEGDDSDDEKEREIDGNLDALAGITGRLKGLAVATGQEVDRQNAQISGIMKKSDGVDNQIAITHNAIKKIH